MYFELMNIACASSRPHRRWLRFGLRAFFLFVTLVALGAAWIGSQIAQRHQEQTAVSTLVGNSDGTTTTIVESRFDRYPSADINPLNPPWQGKSSGFWQGLRNLDLFRRVIMFSAHPKGNSFRFSQTPDGHLAIEREYKAGLTDSDMSSLGKLANLRSIWLEANGITDQGLVQLSNLNQLEILWLQHTPVTDRGMAVLANFPHLRDLDLSGTNVTDAAVEMLAKCSQLKHLTLKNTNVSPHGIATLRQRLPNCQIEN